MNKFIAVSLPFLWFFYCFFHDHDYAWVIRTFVGLNMGYACAYTWSYYDLRNEPVTK